jgi:hypothetical protein
MVAAGGQRTTPTTGVDRGAAGAEEPGERRSCQVAAARNVFAADPVDKILGLVRADAARS